MLGMPAEIHLTFGSNSSDPAMRDCRMTSHLARYSGVSFGALSGRPSRPSSTNTGRGGGNAPSLVTAGDGAAGRLNWPNGSTGMYTPVKSGGGGPCARSDDVVTNSRHRNAENKTTIAFDMMSPSSCDYRAAGGGGAPTTLPSARLTRVRRPVWVPSFAGLKSTVTV